MAQRDDVRSLHSAYNLPAPDELASDLVSSKLNSDVKFKVGSSGGGGEVLLGVGQKGYNPV